MSMSTSTKIKDSEDKNEGFRGEQSKIEVMVHLVGTGSLSGLDEKLQPDFPTTNGPAKVDQLVEKALEWLEMKKRDCDKIIVKCKSDKFGEMVYLMPEKELEDGKKYEIQISRDGKEEKVKKDEAGELRKMAAQMKRTRNRRMSQLLISAVFAKNLMEVGKLIGEGADVNTADGNTYPLRVAVGTENVEMVKLLVERGANLEANGVGRRPLHLAALYNNEEILRFLLEKGADIKSTDDRGCTVLHIASSFCSSPAVMSTLLAHLLEKLGEEGKKAFVNTKNNFGNTALHSAYCYKKLISWIC